MDLKEDLTDEQKKEFFVDFLERENLLIEFHENTVRSKNQGLAEFINMLLRTGTPLPSFFPACFPFDMGDKEMLMKVWEEKWIPLFDTTIEEYRLYYNIRLDSFIQSNDPHIKAIDSILTDFSDKVASRVELLLEQPDKQRVFHDLWSRLIEDINREKVDLAETINEKIKYYSDEGACKDSYFIIWYLQEIPGTFFKGLADQLLKYNTMLFSAALKERADEEKDFLRDE